MNERIRELADQARFVKTAEYPSQDEVFEKFAELIVKECVQVANKTVIGSDFVGNAIRKHFGVE
jgi:hypothetical protein